MDLVKIKDKTFFKYLTNEEIQKTVKNIAEKITVEYKDKNPVLLGVLNGSFMFIADLIKNIDIECEISFIKMSSYTGTKTKGEAECLIGINENLEDRNVIIVEDIVDTGITMENILSNVRKHKPSDIKIVSLFFKPNSFEKKFNIDIVGLIIPNEFIVGYGLDYDGLGRNLNDVYKLNN